MKRSIPASAGEPAEAGVRRDDEGVYPRECGGTPCLFTWAQRWKGLSPRVRGNRGSRSGNGSGDGSIPASAGEPPATSDRRRWGRVYPRECGGTVKYLACYYVYYGLSPRVRGNLPLVLLLYLLYRSIPASAGEPSSISPVTTSITVYPRECGGTCH